MILAAGTLIFAILSARSSKKSKVERQAAALQQTREAERLEAEEERISVNAAHEAVRIVRGELREAHEKMAAQGLTITAQGQRIDKQNRIIRRQNVRMELQQEQIGALHRALVAKDPDTPPLATPPDDDLWPEGDEL